MYFPLIFIKNVLFYVNACFVFFSPKNTYNKSNDMYHNDENEFLKFLYSCFSFFRFIKACIILCGTETVIPSFCIPCCLLNKYSFYICNNLMFMFFVVVIL